MKLAEISKTKMRMYLRQSEPGKLLTLDDVEERYIRKVIKENDKKNKGEICEILGVSRPTLERKLEKYGISFERE